MLAGATFRMYLSEKILLTKIASAERLRTARRRFLDDGEWPGRIMRLVAEVTVISSRSASAGGGLGGVL